ncbi:MAG: type I-C CRISPR-associated protein Cas8c/Csd1 [Clostridiales bacterium]|jgi:CRISPR-associated protein Csd1|nr:type I-C CRISPR-associated protein Cas8c/Csd1 [Clostridiales bacterium]
MILNALVKRYDDTLDIPFGWQRRAVKFTINISLTGELLSITRLGDPEAKNASETFILPAIGKGRSGKKSYETVYFLCDNDGYMLGKDEKKFESARNFYHEVLKNDSSVVGKAILAYFNNEISQVAKDFEPKVIGDYIFKVEDEYITFDNIDMRLAWNEYSKENTREAGNELCAITGERGSIIKLHNKIELSGVTMGKQPLISMNAQKSFRSYGADVGDAPAQIGEVAAFKYASALNNLLKDEKHHKFWGNNDTLVYWADNDGEHEAEIFKYSLDSSLAPPNIKSELDTIAEHFAKGKLPNLQGCDWDRTFYMACLSPNAARISLRFFYQSTFGNIEKSILEHYKRLEIYSSRDEKFSMLPPWIIVNETKPEGKNATVMPFLSSQLMKSIVTDTPYPLTLYNLILLRIFAGKPINRTKSAIIKAILIKNFNEREVTTMSLNKESTNQAYVLGRLFAVMEKMQKDAAQAKSGTKLNSTIRDKFFSSACSSPASVFPTLLGLSVHHITPKNYSQQLEILKSKIINLLNDEFPKTLALKEQGEFILGYYHQEQDLYTSHKEDN